VWFVFFHRAGNPPDALIRPVGTVPNSGPLATPPVCWCVLSLVPVRGILKLITMHNLQGGVGRDLVPVSGKRHPARQ